VTLIKVQEGERLVGVAPILDADEDEPADGLLEGADNVDAAAETPVDGVTDSSAESDAADAEE
jgi:hypothetical protein